MGISIKVNASGALLMLAQAQDQLPYAMSLALNRVAVDGQKAEQERLKRAFHLRRETFVIRGIKIEKTDRASKTSWAVVISIPVAQDFLSKFEEGTPKVPRQGKWLWIPNPDVFRNKIINRGNPLHPKNLHFQKAKGQIKGEQRTFMLRVQGREGPLVMQRVDRMLKKGASSTMRAMTLDNVRTNEGAFRLKERESAKSIHRMDGNGVRLLYKLVAKVKTPVRLEFVSTITNRVIESWPARMDEALREALRTAR